MLWRRAGRSRLTSAGPGQRWWAGAKAVTFSTRTRQPQLVTLATAFESGEKALDDAIPIELAAEFARVVRVHALPLSDAQVDRVGVAEALVACHSVTIANAV